MQMKAADKNVLLFRTFLSIWGALSLGFFGLLVGLVWGGALGAGMLLGAAVVGIVGAVWGALTFQLTPTGGIVMENKATVNYAVIALHGYFAAFVSAIGLIVWALRVWVF